MIIDNHDKEKIEQVAQKFNNHKDAAFQFIISESKADGLAFSFGKFSGDTKMKPFILASLVDNILKEDPTIFFEAMNIVTDKDNRELNRLANSFADTLTAILDKRNESHKSSVHQ